MSHVLLVCVVVLLCVYSVAAQMRQDNNTSGSERIYSPTVSANGTSRRTQPPHGQHQRGHPAVGHQSDIASVPHGRRFLPYDDYFFHNIVPYRPVEPPKVDPWPDRPHDLKGASKEFPLRKCCPERWHLNGKLQGCEFELETESPRPWLKLPLSTEGAGGVRFPPCASDDMLRLGSVDASDLLSFSASGALRLRVLDVHNNGSLEVDLDREVACADVVLGNEAPFAVLLCPCNRTACVRKCCGKRQALVVKEASVATVTPGCEELPTELLGSWNPQIDASAESREAPAKKGFVVLPGTWPTHCEWGRTRAPPSWAKPKPGVDFKIFPGGRAFIMTIPRKETPNFCVDGERIASGSLVPSIVFCADPVPVPVVDRWMSALGVVGALALAAAVAVHALLPELRATPFGRALMTYAAAMLALAVIGLAWTMVPDVSRARCIFNVTWTQYFLQAAAFWLNVMCYDIGIAFRSYNGALDRKGRAARKRFIRYAMYAWGCPLISVAPLMALQFTHPPGHPWRPIEWFMKCHYSNSVAQFVFLYLPIILLLILNCGIFVWTAYRIRVLQKDSDILTEDDSTEESPYPPRKRLLLFLKLLWLMGVTETLLEVIAWGVSPASHWYTSNAVDFSRALSIFGLSCCKGSVLKRLRERFRERVCCAALRRGSRVGQDPDPGADADDNTDTTSVFSSTTRASGAQDHTSQTAGAQVAVWDAYSTQASTSTAISTTQDDISSVPMKQDGLVNTTSSQNGIFKGAANRGVTEKEAEKDSEPPPTGGIEMKVLSTTSL